MPNWSGEVEALSLQTRVLSQALASLVELSATSLVEPDQVIPLYVLAAEIDGTARQLVVEGAR